MNSLITIENEKPILKEEMVLKIIEIEDKIKQLKSIQDDYKKEIMSAMEEKNVIKILDDTSGLSITYI